MKTNISITRLVTSAQADTNIYNNSGTVMPIGASDRTAPGLFLPGLSSEKTRSTWAEIPPKGQFLC